VQNVGFGNLTWKAPVRLVVLEDLEGSDLGVCPDPTYYDLPEIDSRDIHSRTISVAGGDTVMTFDGNNEMEIEVKLNKLSRGRYQVYLKVGEIEFANSSIGGRGSCGMEQPAAYMGKFYYDENAVSIMPRASRSFVQKSQTPYVLRKRNNVIIRNGECSYKSNGSRHSSF
jgi:hypothetical protein